MAKPLMPEAGGDSASERRCRRSRRAAHRIQVTAGVTAEDHRPGSEVLNRKATRVKFNRDRVVTAELPDRKKVLNERGANDNVAELYGRSVGDERACANMRDGQALATADDDMRMRSRRTNREEVTR